MGESVANQTSDTGSGVSVDGSSPPSRLLARRYVVVDELPAEMA